MTKLRSAYCCLVIEEHVGALVAAVVKALTGSGRAALPSLIQRTGLRLNQVRKCLCVLIQHGFVDFEAEPSGRVVYHCNADAVEQFSRLPLHIRSARKLHGAAAEAVVDELGCGGRLTVEECVLRAVKRLDMAEADVRAVFVQLVEDHLIARAAQPVDAAPTSSSACPTLQPPPNPFAPPPSTPAEMAAGSSRKRKADESPMEPLWRVNYEMFDERLRDESLCEAMALAANEQCARLLRLLLRHSESRTPTGSLQSAPITFHEAVRAGSSASPPVSKETVEQSLAAMTSLQCRQVRKSGESGGGLFFIDFERAAELACRRVLESVVRERHQTKGLRVFRLLSAKGFLEQTEIERFAMLPSKEGKELVYALLADQFIHVKEVSRGTDFTPSRTFYLFHVDLLRCVRHQREHCLKTLGNLILRHRHETQQFRSLSERQEKVDKIVENIEADEALDEEKKQQQVDEVNDAYLTAAEKEQLARHRRAQLALLRAQAQIARTLFQLGHYLRLKHTA